MALVAALGSCGPTLVSANGAIVEAALADWATRDRAAALRLFVPEARTLAASARIALGHALRESAWMGSDARVNEAKSAWWLEEFTLSGRGQPRHPLTSFLMQKTAPFDFAQLSREFARLRAMQPHDESGDALDALGGLEHALWFGPATLDETACATRARAALIDVLDRSDGFGKANDGNTNAGSDAAAHATALRAAPPHKAATARRPSPTRPARSSEFRSGCR